MWAEIEFEDETELVGLVSVDGALLPASVVQPGLLVDYYRVGINQPKEIELIVARARQIGEAEYRRLNAPQPAVTPRVVSRAYQQVWAGDEVEDDADEDDFDQEPPVPRRRRRRRTNRSHVPSGD